MPRSVSSLKAFFCMPLWQAHPTTSCSDFTDYVLKQAFEGAVQIVEAMLYMSQVRQRASSQRSGCEVELQCSRMIGMSGDIIGMA